MIVRVHHLAQAFIEKATGSTVTVAISHLKSKGSACDDVGDSDTGDGQGNCNLTRTAAAQAMVDWLADDGNVLILGDLNAYAMEDPVAAIKAGGYTDLLATYEGLGGYSYSFMGQFGHLDHGLASAALAPQVTGAATWHINADEPTALDYNTYNQALLYQPDPYRASDHDPVVVGLALTVEPKVLKERARDALGDLLPSGDKKDDARIEKAIEHLARSLEPALWTADGRHLTEQGMKVFVNEKKAVHELLKVEQEISLLGDVIDALATADRALAQTAIDEAVEAGGDAGMIAKAEAEMVRAQDALERGDPEEAIQRYKQAWGHAVIAAGMPGAAEAISASAVEEMMDTSERLFLPVIP